MDVDQVWLKAIDDCLGLPQAWKGRRRGASNGRPRPRGHAWRAECRDENNERPASMSQRASHPGRPHPDTEILGLKSRAKTLHPSTADWNRQGEPPADGRQLDVVNHSTFNSDSDATLGVRCSLAGLHWRALLWRSLQVSPPCSDRVPSRPPTHPRSVGSPSHQARRKTVHSRASASANGRWTRSKKTKAAAETTTVV